MADTEEFVDGETLPECPAQVGSAAAFRGEQVEPLKTETTIIFTPGEEGDSPLQIEGDPSLLSMPCLMKELRRDSPESQHASTGSDKPTSGHVYESDDSNPCMLSPSSSGHQADSDTLSSGEEGAASRASGEEGTMVADTGLAAGCQTSSSSRQKSRRSRSESEMSTNTMAAKKNRCQPAVAGGAGGEKQTNGRLAKVKGHRSQKHKERIRLLRQKREAAARKKYNLLQDSSTSDSDLTCDSSTSSSEDETSGGKTIPTDIPAEGSGVSAQIQGLLDGGGSWDRNSIGSVLEEAMTRFAVMQRQTEERFRVWMEKLTRLDSDDSGDSSIHSSDTPVPHHRHRAPRPSPPSSFLPSSESQETMVVHLLARENANISMSSMSPDPLNNNNNNNNNNILPDVVPLATQNGNLDIPDPGIVSCQHLTGERERAEFYKSIKYLYGNSPLRTENQMVTGGSAGSGSQGRPVCDGAEVKQTPNEPDDDPQVDLRTGQGVLEAFPDDTKHAKQKCEEDLVEAIDDDGPPVVGHYDISDTDSNQESLSVTVERVCLRRTTVITHERLKTHRDQDMGANSEAVRVQHLCSLSAGHMEAELAHREPPQHKGHINIPSSDSEVEIVGVQENTRCAHPRAGVIQSLSSAWKPNSGEHFNNSTRQSSQLWNTASPQPNWVSPPEVVDLTLDEDTRHKFLL